jgi:protein associated with RNAse G/E
MDEHLMSERPLFLTQEDALKAIEFDFDHQQTQSNRQEQFDFEEQNRVESMSKYQQLSQMIEVYEQKISQLQGMKE